MRAPHLFLAVLLSAAPLHAQTLSCGENVLVLPPTRTYAEKRPIRLDDERRRTDYARLLTEKANIIYTQRESAIAPSDIKLTSLYLAMVGDPANIRRYIGTKSQNRRVAELRRQLFGVNAPGRAGTTPSDRDLAPSKALLNDLAVRKLQSGDWLADFPSLIVNRSQPGNLRDLFALENNAGDFLSDEKAYDKAHLLGGRDQFSTFDVTFVSKRGVQQKISFSTLAEALSQLQSRKTDTCAAYVYIYRYWFHRPFVEKYSVSDVSGNAHILGQLRIWDDRTISDLQDWSRYAFLRNSFMVTGLWFAVSGDNVIVDSMSLEPIVASRN